MWRLAIAAVLVISGCSSSTPSRPPRTTSPSMSRSSASSSVAPPSPASTSPSSTTTAPFRPSHIVVVMEENKGYDEVMGGGSAPYIRSLASAGAVFTNFFAITHPSEPNYLALFSGSTQGVTGDDCPLTFSGGNLGHSLLAAGRSFVGYSESLPAAGSTVCSSGSGYARKHSPWVNFTDLPATVNQPFSSFPTDYTRLPTLSFVIPNLEHDMHDGTIGQGDAWLREHLGGYATWARAHDSELAVLFDESEGGGDNRIPAVVYGAHVRAGSYPAHLNLYSALRLFEDTYGLPRLGRSATAPAVPAIWR